MRALDERTARYYCAHGMTVDIKTYAGNYHRVFDVEVFNKRCVEGHVTTTYMDVWLWLINQRRRLHLEYRGDNIVECLAYRAEFPRINKDKPLATGAEDAETAIQAMIILLAEWDLL